MNTNQILTEGDSRIVRDAILDQIDRLNHQGGISGAISWSISRYLDEHELRAMIMDGIERSLCSGREMYDAIESGVYQSIGTGTEVTEAIFSGAKEGAYLAALEKQN